MDLISIKQRLEVLPSEIEKAGKEYAHAQAIFHFEDKMIKTVLANCTYQSMHEVSVNKMVKPSMAKAEMIALTRKEYIEQNNLVKEKEEEYGVKKAIYEAKKAEFEATRSLLSLEKSLSEMK